MVAAAQDVKGMDHAALWRIRWAALVQLGVCGRTDNLGYAFVIEPDRHAAWGKENCDSISNDKRPRMVHLEPPSSVQFNGEYAKRLELPESF